MTTYRTKDGNEYEEYTKFARYHAPCGIDWIPLQISEKVVKSYDLSQLREVVDPRLTGMVYDQPAEAPIVYTCAEPPKDPREADNIIALTEILNSRNAERQVSRDLYIYNLTCDIEEALAA